MKFLNLSDYGICTGLIEEEGFTFAGKKIIYYKNIDYRKYDLILITILGKSKETMKKLEGINIKSKIMYVSKKSDGICKIIYDIYDVNK